MSKKIEKDRGKSDKKSKPAPAPVKALKKKDAAPAKAAKPAKAAPPAKAVKPVKPAPKPTHTVKSSKPGTKLVQPPPAPVRPNLKAKVSVKKPEKIPLKSKSKPDSKLKVKAKAKKKEPVSTIRVSVPKAEPVKVAPVKMTKELIEIRSRLQTMLSEIGRDIDHEVRGAGERDLAHLNDTSDMATDAAEGDLALRIAESETVEAEEIERAIEKVDNGTYGICEMCNKPIGVERLKFLPYVTLCIKCQELSEIRRRDDGDELDDLAEGAETDNDA